MSIGGRIQRQLYLWRMAKVDRQCVKHGHMDNGCYSITGDSGVHCSHCGRILWKRRDGTTEYQAPSRRSDANWR
jgi:DNA-directed RNA polymerase subunit RPC12/RpoP